MLNWDTKKKDLIHKGLDGIDSSSHLQYLYDDIWAGAHNFTFTYLIQAPIQYKFKNSKSVSWGFQPGEGPGL